MKEFNALGRFLTSYNTTCLKNGAVVFLIVTLIFATISMIYLPMIIFAVMFVIVCLCFYLAFITRRKVYDKKVIVDDNLISVYDYKKTLIKTFQLDALTSSYYKLAFPYARGCIYRKCLVLHEKDFKICSDFRYTSHCYNSNIVIIENNLFIAMLENKIKNFDFNANDYSNQIKNFNESVNLGKIKIEYDLNGNIIRVYNSPKFCTLVINEKILDQYVGFVGYPFCLKGTLILNGEKVLIEAELGHLFLCLYCNGNLLAKTL